MASTDGPNPLTASTAGPASADIETKVRSQASKMAGDWTDLPEGHVLLKMSAALPGILQEAGHSEMYGVALQAPAEGETAAPFSTLIILQKFLRANSANVAEATKQLTAALKWRKEFQPLKVVDEVFDKSRFEGLGYVAALSGVPGSSNQTDVCAFNIYGAVKDTKKTFGDLDGFIRWRVALMELTVRELHLADAKMPIPDYGKGADPYLAYQVHDYLSVSFLRQPSEVKAASSKTIQLFQEVYPETMAKKYFVNVPIFMQWMFAAMQIFMAKETIAKMQWMSHGAELHKHLGASVPKAYGGSGADLVATAITPKYDDGGADGGADGAGGAGGESEQPAAPASVPATAPVVAEGSSASQVDGAASASAQAPPQAEAEAEIPVVAGPSSAPPEISKS